MHFGRVQRENTRNMLKCYSRAMVRGERGLGYYLLRAVRGVRTMGAAAAAAAAAAVLGLADKGVADAPSRLHGTVGNLNPVGYQHSQFSDNTIYLICWELQVACHYSPFTKHKFKMHFNKR